MDRRQWLYSANNVTASSGSSGSSGVPIENLDYAADGGPFNDTPAKSGITLSGMDYAFNGQPFVTNGSGA